MNVTFYPSTASGKVCAPPSKSMAHRALICAALSEKSRISNIAGSRDIEATANCLKCMGASLTDENGILSLGGLNVRNIPDNTELFCDESGSTLRFLIPLCMLSGKQLTLNGSDRLLSRPLGVYADIAEKNNGRFEISGNKLTVRGGLIGGKYRVPGNVSSQFISGLLFALPLLPDDSHIIVDGTLESASYIDLTLQMLGRFGVSVTRDGNNIYVPGNQRFRANDYTVEGDYSNAAFLEAFNLLGGKVEVTGLDPGSKQGDRVYKRFFSELSNGCRSFDLTDCPDLGPLMFALASLGQGAEFTGTARLRLKESDRVVSMTEELKKFGVVSEIYENSVVINGNSIRRPDETLCGHNDHRIVMALSVLCSKFGGTLSGAQAVTKSFPDFFEILKQLKIGMLIDEA